MSLKTDLIGEQIVGFGGFQKILQSYQLYHYPPEVNIPTDKIRLALIGKENGNFRFIRSLYFDKIETHQRFILNNIIYHLYWLEKKGINFKPEVMPISDFRKTLKFKESN